MGIKGLTRYLTAKCNKTLINKEVLPENSTLLIDGNGFMFYILSIPKVENSFNRELGGNYNILNEAIKEEIQKYLNAGLKVQVYFDGISRMKGETSEKRLQERMNMWTRLFNACNEGEILKQDDLPVPPLVSTQFRMTLRSISEIEIIMCDEEADQELAKICCNKNINLEKGKELYYCYGNDTDFIVMKDCPYIKFVDLIIDNDNKVIANKIWRRSEISSCLNMSEQKFVEFCIYVGNDYTQKFSRSNYKSIVNVEDLLRDFNSDSDSYSEDSDIDNINEGSFNKVAIDLYTPNYIGELKDDLLSREDGIQLESNNENLQQAIEFSRALYELQDLTSYPVELIDKEENNEENEIKIKLNTEQEQLLNDIYKNNHINGVVTVNSAIKSLSIAIDTNSSIFNTITPLHIQAFNMMAAVMNQKDSNYSLNSINKFPNWKDLLASHIFQLCSSHQIKYIKNKSSLKLTNHSPVNLYSGEAFHSCLNHLREIENNNNNNNNNNNCTNEIVNDVEVIEAKTTILPIDLHKDEILNKIANDRVIIIHGETGCGKSSRLPVMLYEEAQRLHKPCKMMISQPRRIAASSLMKRVRESIGDKVGMRMGHGVRDETDKSCIYFVTTGYLVRLLAHHPEQFINHSHIIIDEVHERSIDGDLLCLLARRLLEVNKNIKLILMSATIHTALYKDYFLTNDEYYGDMECLSVGVRRFPLDIKYLEDLISGEQIPQLTKPAKALINLTSKCIINIF
jgi:siroheme synthase (precorrin-2 oxidase/ferrochelatase)